MTDELSRNEHIKEASDYLRGTLAEGLREEITGAIVEDDQQLVKFHGMYLQDDRDLRAERARKKLEKAFAFMMRVRISGGVLHAGAVAARSTGSRAIYGNGTMRADHAPDLPVARRHQVEPEGDAEGDRRSAARHHRGLRRRQPQRDVQSRTRISRRRTRPRSSSRAAISDHLMPHTGAYREIWLDGEKIAGGEPEEVEPIYGKTYLPRKFKIVVAVPPSNDVDMFAHDLGFIAILDEAGDDRRLERHGRRRHGHDPRRAGHLSAHRRRDGLLPTRDAVAVAEAVVTVQRDWGDRTNRKHARLKYTIEDRGLDAFRAEVEKRVGVTLDAPRPFAFTSTGDRYGWTEGENGNAHLTLFVENGRIHDAAGGAAACSPACARSPKCTTATSA